MFGGIISSAILTFFVVPAAFFLFERKRAVKQDEREAVEEQVAAKA
jgi:Cu/Ag efflux pump CusA